MYAIIEYKDETGLEVVYSRNNNSDRFKRKCNLIDNMNYEVIGVLYTNSEEVFRQKRLDIKVTKLINLFDYYKEELRDLNTRYEQSSEVYQQTLLCMKSYVNHKIDFFCKAFDNMIQNDFEVRNEMAHTLYNHKQALKQNWYL